MIMASGCDGMLNLDEIVESTSPVNDLLLDAAMSSSGNTRRYSTETDWGVVSLDDFNLCPIASDVSATELSDIRVCSSEVLDSHPVRVTRFAPLCDITQCSAAGDDSIQNHSFSYAQQAISEVEMSHFVGTPGHTSTADIVGYIRAYTGHVDH